MISHTLIAKELKDNHKIAVIKTDTLYGLVGSADSKEAIARIYKIKNRNHNKPLIVLIANYSQLKVFDVPTKYIQKTKKYWPGPYSLILPVSNRSYSYLSKEGKVAFRLPKSKWLNEFIKVSGPIVAPSANPEGLTPAKNVTEAKAYFGSKIDYYIDKGECTNTEPSKLIDLTTDKLLR